MLKILLVMIVSSTFAYADCEKCKRVREYNAAHPENNYEYYDDYLKAQQGKQEAPKKAEESSSLL